MKKKVLTTIGWLISAVLIASLFAKLDLRKMWQGFANAKWSWLILAAAINFTVVAMKTVRWQWLMRPETRTRFGNIFRATIIGMAGNNVLPARGGDLFKIYLIGKWENVSKTVLASITGLDKIFEGLTILILFGTLSLHSTFPEWVRKGTVIVSITVSVLLIISILLLLHHRRTPSHLTEGLGKISKFAKKLGSGFSALASGRLAVTTLFISIAICLTQIVTIWCCQKAFDQSLGLWGPALVFVAINLAIMIPSAPSGVGPFEVAAVLAYSWMGVRAEMGFDIAITYHAIQFIPITLVGAIMYMRSTSATTDSTLRGTKDEGRNNKALSSIVLANGMSERPSSLVNRRTHER